MKLLFTLMTLLFAFSGPAFASSQYKIQQLINPDGSISLEQCSNRKCSQIGPKSSYKMKELQELPTVWEMDTVYEIMQNSAVGYASLLACEAFRSGPGCLFSFTVSFGFHYMINEGELDGIVDRIQVQNQRTEILDATQGRRLRTVLLDTDDAEEMSQKVELMTIMLEDAVRDYNRKVKLNEITEEDNKNNFGA